MRETKYLLYVLRTNLIRQFDFNWHLQITSRTITENVRYSDLENYVKFGMF